MAHELHVTRARELSAADNRLWLEIRRVLHEYEPLRATRAPLVVDVAGGRVRLAGRTRSESLRLTAAYLVSFVSGVLAVDNEIVSDDMVIRAVADALADDPLTAPHVIQVNARYGEVTLVGEVSGPEVETRALELAGSVPLATGTRSELAIARPPAAAPSAI